MKKDHVIAFLLGIATASLILFGVGATRPAPDIQRVMLVDPQGQPLVGQGRYLPIGTANGGSVEIRSGAFGLQVQGLK